MKPYQKEILGNEVNKIQKAGFKVFLSKNGQGDYGFYTDGERIVSFQFDFSSIVFSGNYKSKKSGTGWRLGDGLSYSQMIKTYPPNWITCHDEIKMASIKDYLKGYQRSSKFKLIKDKSI